MFGPEDLKCKDLIRRFPLQVETSCLFWATGLMKEGRFESEFLLNNSIACKTSQISYKATLVMTAIFS